MYLHYFHACVCSRRVSVPGVFLPSSAAMLCPVLLCAALLLLPPLEITDARALHQPSDAAQVGGEEGEKGRKLGKIEDCWEGKQEGIRAESNEMYQ